MTSAEVNPEQAAKNFMQFILESLITDKDQLVLDVKTDDLGILVSIKVSDSDMGKIIGKNGQTIQALRTLLRILGGAHAQRMNLKVIEP